MTPISLHVLYDNNKPLIAAIHNSAKKTTKIFHLYHKSTGIPVEEAENNIAKVRGIIVALILKKYSIITSDFKRVIKAFNLDLSESVDVYDACLDSKYHIACSDIKESEKLVSKVAEHLANKEPKAWQRLFANAGIVYDDLEYRGVLVAGTMKYPNWLQTVYSGRSKTTGFNIQGTTADFDVRNPIHQQDNIFLHFDWKAADIRIAALLSKDDKLLDISYHKDPYLAVAEDLGLPESARKEAKRNLLQAINSLKVDAEAVLLFPKLADWIRDSRRKLAKEGVLESILGRKFSVKRAEAEKKKNPKRSVFNATMQGSIAHAMHRCMKDVWDLVGDRLLCEIHDSLVVTCPNDPKYITQVKNDVVDILKHPFEGLLSDNPSFPITVNIGLKWRKWKKLNVYH